MKAITINTYTPTPSSLRPSTIPTPTPTPTHPLLIRITHCSPQHADILHAQGLHQNNNASRGWCHPPFVLGYDFAGTISDIHPSALASVSAQGLRIDDAVFGASIGAFAEFIAVPARAVRRVPRGLGNADACAMGGGAVAYAAVVHVGRVEPGETVLVSGASGGLGGACCAVSKAVGARVIALVGDEEKARMMRGEMGLDGVVVVDGAGEWVSEVGEMTGGRGVDVVFDHTGMVNEGIRCLAYGGRIVVLGFAARKGVMESVKMNKLLLKSATVTGFRFGETGRRDPQLLERIWEGYLGLMESGKMQVALYGEYRGLGDVGRALGDLAARKVYGKVVVSVAEAEGEQARL